MFWFVTISWEIFENVWVSVINLGKKGGRLKRGAAFISWEIPQVLSRARGRGSTHLFIHFRFVEFAKLLEHLQEVSFPNHSYNFFRRTSSESAFTIHSPDSDPSLLTPLDFLYWRTLISITMSLSCAVKIKKMFIA